MEHTYDLSDLDMLAHDCLTRAGVNDATAAIVARDVALSEAAGHADSGFAALLRDIRLVRYGRLYPDAPATVKISAPAVLEADAGHGFASTALSQALPSLIKTARDQGIAMLHLKNASIPGAMTGALIEIAAADLGAISLRPHGQRFAIRPGSQQITVLDTNTQNMVSSLLSTAPPAVDSPLDGPVAENGWITVLDPRVSATEALLQHLPEARQTPHTGSIVIAPELLAQIVNA